MSIGPGEIAIGGGVLLALLGLGKKKALSNQQNNDALAVKNALQKGYTLLPSVKNTNTPELQIRRVAESAALAVTGIVGGLAASALVSAAAAGTLGTTIAEIAAAASSAGGVAAIALAAWVAILITVAHFAGRAHRWAGWWAVPLETRYWLALDTGICDFTRACLELVIKDQATLPETCSPTAAAAGCMARFRESASWKVTPFDGYFQVGPGVQQQATGIVVEGFPPDLVSAVMQLSFFSAVEEIWARNLGLWRFYTFRGWTPTQIEEQRIAYSDAGFWNWVNNRLLNGTGILNNPVSGGTYAPEAHLVFTPVAASGPAYQSYPRRHPSPVGEVSPYLISSLNGVRSYNSVEAYAQQVAGANLGMVVANAHAVGDVIAMTRAAVDGYSFGWPGDEEYTKVIAANATCSPADWTPILSSDGWWVQHRLTGIVFSVVKSRENETPVFVVPTLKLGA